MAHRHDHGDGHGHGHGRVSRRAAQQRALTLALAANAAFLVAEVVGGVAFGSLALLADAAHMLSDVAALAIALVAARLAVRPATARHSFGLQRAEVLGAQANGVVLLAAAAWILYEAVGRLDDSPDVVGGGLLVVALGGLLVNVGSAFLLHRAGGHSLNMRGALTHLLLDALGSVGAVMAGLAIVLWDATWMDPVVSIVLAVLVLWSAWQLLRDTTHVLLEGTPAGLDPDAITAALVADPDVDLVHHVHVWNLASDTPALSAHVVLNGERTLHDAQASGDRLKHLLLDRFGIEHSTLELECHACDGPDHDAGAEPVPASERE